MKVRIEMSDGTRPGVVRGDEMKAGEYGLVVVDNSGNSVVGHYLYRHNTDGLILDLSDVPIAWTHPELLQVKLLPVGESITITRTE